MDKILKVKNLEVNFITNYGEIKAVRNVSFDLNKGEVLAIVGESGCGKSALCRSLLKLLPRNGYIKSGEILFKKNDLCKVSDEEMNKIRGNDISMIFQNPTTTLNPTITIGKQILEAIRIHNKINKVDAKKIVLQLMDLVGIDNVETRYNQYPYEFSGGQRQRVGIARSLAVEPEFIVCDEPISALDVSIQAQVINMLEELQEEMGLTYLFIAHDLSMVKHISSHIGVMYLGKLVEKGTSEEVYEHPEHPYTKALLSAIPIPDPRASKAKKRIILKGDVPSPIDPPPGCRFASRCRYAKKICLSEEPVMDEISNGHFVACHLYK